MLLKNKNKFCCLDSAVCMPRKCGKIKGEGWSNLKQFSFQAIWGYGFEGFSAAMSWWLGGSLGACKDGDRDGNFRIWWYPRLMVYLTWFVRFFSWVTFELLYFRGNSGGFIVFLLYFGGLMKWVL